MEFKLFSVETTNIYPMANSTKGGQLQTEYNLIGKESALTTPSIEYVAGMSFVHSESEFLVASLSADINYLNPGVEYTNNAIMITKGKAVVNGYFIERLIDTVIDLADINMNLAPEDRLVGNLAIGLKTYFSNGGVLNGAILAEEYTDPTDPTSDMVFGGVQVVICNADDVRTPRTIKNNVNYGDLANQNQCNMDLLLATFNYTNGNVSNIIPNPTRLQCIPGSRIEAMDSVLSTSYVRKSGLQQNRFYTFAGKGTDPETGYDTWCDSTDALMVWDDAAPRISDTPPIKNKASFISTDSGVKLYIPHKQIDGMVDANNNPQYFESVELSLPVASFALGSAGIVDKTYTKQVKDVVDVVHELYTMPYGKQRAFIDVLDDVANLPTIYQGAVSWEPGDYVLVAKDNTINSDLNDTLNLSGPSTMYVVLPPLVRSVGSPIDPDTHQAIDRPTGTELAIAYLDQENDNIGSANPLDQSDWWDIYSYRGSAGNHDYFTLRYTSYDEQHHPTVTDYFYPVATTDGIKVYSDPIQLTGQYPFATETMTGGFLDVDTANIDNGYVYLDEDGHLRLLDYGLLRTGVLAYQLGEDFTMPSGLTYEEMQANLDEYINERVAFPNSKHIANAESNNIDPNVININLNLPKSDDTVTLEIKNIDSRFNTAVCINLTGEADSNTVIFIDNCQKVRIKSSYTSIGPAIAVTNSCLYYDATIIDYISTMRYDTYWYKRYDVINDPHIIVDGMTIRSTVETSNALSVENINYWTSDSPNDNHIQILTKSITISDEGNICGCSVLIRNNTTNNVSMGRNMILDTFTLPNVASILPIPESKLTQPIYVTGEFIAAYPPTDATGYICINTQFTLRTQTISNPGQLAVMMDAYNMASANPVPIDSWSPDTYHMFDGSANNL